MVLEEELRLMLTEEPSSTVFAVAAVGIQQVVPWQIHPGAQREGRLYWISRNIPSLATAPASMKD